MSIYIHTKIGMVPKLEVLEGQTTFVERERESERERIKRIYRKARIEGGPLVRWQEETQCNNLSLSLHLTSEDVQSSQFRYISQSLQTNQKHWD